MDNIFYEFYPLIPFFKHDFESEKPEMANMII